VLPVSWRNSPLVVESWVHLRESKSKKSPILGDFKRLTQAEANNHRFVIACCQRGEITLQNWNELPPQCQNDPDVAILFIQATCVGYDDVACFRDSKVLQSACKKAIQDSELMHVYASKPESVCYMPISHSMTTAIS